MNSSKSVSEREAAFIRRALRRIGSTSPFWQAHKMLQKAGWSNLRNVPTGSWAVVCYRSPDGKARAELDDLSFRFFIPRSGVPREEWEQIGGALVSDYSRAIGLQKLAPSLNLAILDYNLDLFRRIVRRYAKKGELYPKKERKELDAALS